VCLVDLLPDKDSKGAIVYRHNSCDIVVQMLDQIGVRVANELQHAGYMPPQYRVEPDFR